METILKKIKSDRCTLFHSYLNKRRLFVQCNGFSSMEYIQFSGVRQGSVQEPLFFIIYINNFTYKQNVDYPWHAHDPKLMWFISSDTDCILSQNAIHAASTWCSNNKLLLNIEKCRTILFPRKLNTSSLNHEFQGICRKDVIR